MCAVSEWYCKKTFDVLSCMDTRDHSISAHFVCEAKECVFLRDRQLWGEVVCNEPNGSRVSWKGILKAF